MPLIVGVLGIPGVGKTFLANSVQARHPNIVSISGGTLLQRRLLAARDALRLTSEDAVLNNQEIVCDEFKLFARSSAASTILFDGHCVVNTGFSRVEIPSSVFRDMGVTRMAFVWETPSLILARRNADATRHRASQSLSEIEQEQDASLAVCQRIVGELAIAFCTVASCEIEEFERFVLAGPRHSQLRN